MKLTTVLLLAVVLHISAAGYSQKITLDLRNVTLQKVFKEIRKQTGVSFFYNTEMLRQAGKVSVHVRSEDLEDVLKKCLSNLQFDYNIRNNTVVLSEKPIPAPLVAKDSVAAVVMIDLSGTVKDSVTGQGLPGASVRVKGSDRGTSTDAKGAFTLQVPEGSGILVISYVGYENTEVAFTKAGSFNISLRQKETAGNEVVVVGYGTQRKKEVSSAISQISGKEVLESQSVSLSNSIAGKIPGLLVNQTQGRPGADEAQIFIRGQSTTGNSSALIVVDGIANRDGIDRVDPNDIESVTVLKDASAAIYGAQSGNGVILITTKRGKNGRPRITYSYNDGLISPTILPRMADAATFAKGVNDLALQQGQAAAYTDQQIADFASGKTPSTNWLKTSYKDYFMQTRHSLTVSGGSENVRYFLSGGFTTQGTLLRKDNTSGYQQYNFRSNVDVQASKRLSIGLDLSGRRDNRNYNFQDANSLFSAVLVTPPTVAATINGLPTYGKEGVNPLEVAVNPGYNRTQNNLVSGTARFEYKLPGIEGLALDGFAALDYGQSQQKIWQVPNVYYTEDANGVVTEKQASNTIQLTEYSREYTSITLNGRVKYEHKFNNVHAVTGFIAVEKNTVTADTLGAARFYTSAQVDQIFAGLPTNQTTSGVAGQTARLNYFGRVGYTYDNKYIAQFQMRYDGSQIFPESKRFGLFPGGSLAWVMSEEPFLKNNKVVSNLKLRGSYGLLGNDRITPFQYLSLYTVSAAGYVFNGQDANAINPGVAPNPNVTWEKKRTLDIGIETGFLQNKLQVEFDYFKNHTYDILAKRSISVPTYTGLQLPYENIGTVDNNGFDGQINYKGRIGRVSFNVGGNITYANNKVIFADEGTALPAYQKQEGRPIGALVAYQVIGVYRTAADLAKYPGLPGAQLGDLIYKDVNGDGVINSTDEIRLNRNSIPRLQYGFLFGASFEGFDFSGNFLGQAQALTQFSYVSGAGSNTPAYYINNAWSPKNPNAPLARLGRSLDANTQNIRNVAFVRLKNIELGYTVPRAWVSRIGFQGIRVYVNAFNLLTLYKYKKDGLPDPESTNPQGWQFPLTKSVNFGVNVNL